MEERVTFYIRKTGIVSVCFFFFIFFNCDILSSTVQHVLMCHQRGKVFFIIIFMFIFTHG